MERTGSDHSGTVIITGSAGLIGAESSRYFASAGYDVVGIDNDMRSQFFGSEASTKWAAAKLEEELVSYEHREVDIRDINGIERIFKERNNEIVAVIHTAAQPSHDWACKDPAVDFEVNARGTLNLLESFRRNASSASFVFTSTNKVYGDRPNLLPLVEEEERYELYDSDGELSPGIDESMSVDQSKHSLFGVSKLSADVMVQEYGRYFGLKTVCFRGGCLTGGGHSGTELHGFLSYLMKCTVSGRPYRVFGYKGKQVRDNIHSSDLVSAFAEFIGKPTIGAVYNIGGGRGSNCSMLEAISACEVRAKKKLQHEYVNEARQGDHQWYVSNLERFKRDYPNWKLNYSIDRIFDAVYEGVIERT